MTFAKTRRIGWFRSRLQRLVRLGRAHGQRRAAYRIVKRLTMLPVLRRCVRFCVVEVLTASTDELGSPGRIPKSFVVERAGDDEQALADYFGRAEYVHQRLGRSDVCVVTRCNGNIGAGVWLGVGPNEYREDWDELGCVFRVPAGVGWSFDGKGTKWGAWGSLMARLPEYLDELHVEEVYTLIDYDNRESLDGHYSLGYRRAALVGCVAILGLPVTAYKPSGERWRLAPGRIGRLELSRRA